MLRRILVGFVLGTLLLGLAGTAAQAEPTDHVWQLGEHNARRMWFDEARGRLLITVQGSLIAVNPATGAILDRLDGLNMPGAIVPTDDDAVVWVSDTSAFLEVRLSDLTLLRSVALPSDACGTEGAWAFHRIWVTSACYALPYGSFAPADTSPTLDPTTTAKVAADQRGVFLFASPAGNRLYAYLAGESSGRYELRSGELVLAQAFPAFADVDPHNYGASDLSWDQNGLGLLARFENGGLWLDPDTLQQTGTFPVIGPTGSAVPSPYSDLVGFDAWYGESTAIWDPAINGLLDTIPGGPGAIVWLPGDTFTVMRNDRVSGAVDLVVRTEAGKARSSLTVTFQDPGVPRSPGEKFTLTGILKPPSQIDPEGQDLTFTRTDPSGETIELGTARTSAGGAFAFETEGPYVPTSQRPTFTVSYAGTTKVVGATASVRLKMRAAPWDFNGDGYQDSAVGIPLEDVGSIKNAGAVDVSYGGPDGLSATGTQIWHQDTPGVVGAAEANDQFGYAVTSADYNRDGFADLFVSANNEARGSLLHCGNVTFLPGSAAGLVAEGSKAFMPRDSCAGAYAGDSLAVIEKARSVELYVGAPGADYVYYTDGNLDSPAQGHFEEGDELPGYPQKQGEGFGETMATGDFDGDGVDDLAIGIPFDYDDRGYSTGAVAVVYATNNSTQNQRFTLDTAGIAGTPHLFSKTNASDQFGYALAAGDLNGDGIDDLAIGVPGMDTATSTGAIAVDGGEVAVLPGSATRLRAADSYRLTQESAGVVGAANKYDYFGNSLAIDHDRPGTNATLFVGEWGIQAVHALPGGLGAGSVRIRQESVGVPSSTEPEDGFGWFLRTVHDRGFEAPASLLVAAPGENGYGALFTMPSTGTGITGEGSMLWTENTEGIPGSSEAGDYYGWLGSSR